MAKITTTRQYRKKLEALSEIRARPEKPSRTERRLDAETSAYAVELEGKETKGRPKRSPQDKTPRRSG